VSNEVACEGVGRGGGWVLGDETACEGVGRGVRGSQVTKRHLPLAVEREREWVEGSWVLGNETMCEGVGRGVHGSQAMKRHLPLAMEREREWVVTAKSMDTATYSHR
jgi:hypothetical protein